ncbi:hypothetical protein BWR10_05905 [Lacticaseibacillus rhamnosus]|uniref:Uncharacterized protein n=1 Tax=Lacticaseibacillus rhamnosus TaxID=47715 RepID=A0AAX0K4L6_LACRH|nr:hypothetical protein [Lacticaseibacillus rhamnosus]ONN75158.1 hypothetical protein BWR10_05905 [Lacticaseibacillus rhamnosus]
MSADKATFTAKELYEYLDENFASGVTLRTVQSWLSEDDIYPLDTSKKPFIYSKDDWGKVISKHIKRLVKKETQTVAEERLSKKIKQEEEAKNEYNDQYINYYNKNPEGAELDKTIQKETNQEFLDLKKEFLLKAILYYQTTNIRKTKYGKELDENLLREDVETRVALANVGFDTRTVAQDEALERLSDFKNYLRIGSKS